MKKILFVCTEGFDTPGPSNHLVSSLLEDMLESGFKIHLIQSRRKRINDELPDTLKNKQNLEMSIIDRKIVNKNSFIRRYFEETLYAFKCFKIWRKMKDIDAVFVQSCPTVVFSIVLLKLFMRKPILYSVQDMFPGSAVSSGVIKNKFIKCFFRTFQKNAYNLSDYITAISDDMKIKLLAENVDGYKISVINNWYDDRTVTEVSTEENRFLKKYNLSNEGFYVQYAGTMGHVFNYKVIIEAAKILSGEKDIFFHMIGEGSQKKAFIREKEKYNLDNIIFFPLEPQEMVSDVYSACSVCLIPLKEGVIGNSVPSKAGLLMACRRPIINAVDPNSHYYKMFEENEIGICVANSDAEKLTEVILFMRDNPSLTKTMGINGEKYGKEFYSRSKNTKKYIKVFEDALNQTMDVDVS